MLKLKLTNKFKRDLKLIKKRGYDIKKLEKIITKLMNEEKLETKYKDHELIGNYKNYRECHIESDWLLIYKIIDDVLVLTLSRTGTHSDLFKK
ncbi:MAG: type II toxin-antitoxin system YafQ family toxin [Fusobacterium sp.]|nr:type II toxin-antitoxin system YafQ family toxin [Fusobacterium sp.]